MHFSWHKLADLVDLKMLALVLLAFSCAYFCHHFQVVADYPLSLISVAIVFPIVFSINAAFGRREHALRAFADLKGHCTAFIFACRDWQIKEGETVDLHREIQALIQAIQDFLKNDDVEVEVVYLAFSDLSKQVQAMRGYISAGEMSRLNQYVSKMLISFEQILTIRNYRTSVYLITYGKTLTFLFPILYAPYFGHHINEYDPSWLGYVLPIIYTVVLVALQNIQNLLEDPLDGIGMDDLKLETPDWVRLKEKTGR